MEKQNFGNANVDQVKDEFRKKVERSVWQTIPSKTLY